MANEFIARNGLIVLSNGLIVSGNANINSSVTASFFTGDGSNLTNLNYSNISNPPAGLVSSSIQINSGSFTGSFTGSLLGNASTATTASFATSASAANSITFIPLTASYALTAGTTGGGVTGQGVANRITKFDSVSSIVTASMTDDGTRIQVLVPLTASAITGTFVGDGAGLINVVSSSYSVTSSYALNAGAVNFSTGSYTGSFTGSLLGTATTASFVDASNITLGTLSNARLPSQINVTGVTASLLGIASTASFVDASNITLGTLNNSRLPSQINVVGVTASLLGNAATATSASFAITDWIYVNNKPVGLMSSSAQTVANIAGQDISPANISASAIHVTGRVTAQEFHTQFVSASIIYQSGSTKFGDTTDDVMSVTGSMHVSGSSQFTGPVTFNNGIGSTRIAGSLYSTGSQTVNIGTTVVATVNTGSYDMAHFKYLIKSASCTRTGEVMAVWSASVAEHTDTSTNDIGSTTNLEFDVDVLGENARLKAVVANTNGWTVKTIIQAI